MSRDDSRQTRDFSSNAAMANPAAAATDPSSTPDHPAMPASTYGYSAEQPDSFPMDAYEPDTSPPSPPHNGWSPTSQNGLAEDYPYQQDMSPPAATSADSFHDSDTAFPESQPFDPYEYDKTGMFPQYRPAAVDPEKLRARKGASEVMSRLEEDARALGDDAGPGSDAAQGFLERLLEAYDGHGEEFRVDDYVRMLRLMVRFSYGAENRDSRFNRAIEDAMRINDIATMEEGVALMESYSSLSLRTPLRGTAGVLMRHLEGQSPPSEEQLSLAMHGLHQLGKGMIFHGGLFDLGAQYIEQMSAASASLYAYEGGRHGLRCKHLMDHALPYVIAKVPQMTLDEVMQAAQGFIRFCRDWMTFFETALPIVNEQLGELSVPQLQLVLRFCKEFRGHEDFTALQEAAAMLLSSRHLADMSLQEAARCCTYLEWHPKARPGTRKLVIGIHAKLMDKKDDLSSLSVLDAVDVLDCFGTWLLRSVLHQKLGDILVERIAEVRYSPNIGLWLIALDNFAKADWFHGGYVTEAISIARDGYMLDRLSYFQQCRFINCLARLNYYEYDVYQSMSERLIGDLPLLKTVGELSAVVWAFSKANHVHTPFFDAAYSNLLNMMHQQSMRMETNSTANALVSLAWSFTVAGYHTTEYFSSILDYAFYNKDPHAKMGFKRLQQVADVCLLEIPDEVEKCESRDIIKAIHTSPLVRQLRDIPLNMRQGMSDKAYKYRGKAIEEISACLSELGIAHQIGLEPDPSCPYLIDVAVTGHTRAALIVAGLDRAMRTADVGTEGQPGLFNHTDTGLINMMRRSFQRRGWTVGVITQTQWRGNKADRREQLLDILTDMGVEVPFLQY
ncbi:unnamed protein product [Vitrella brassicaformis CCMP3155]|uniref:RAP domain-containing protein n=1 Tax=Vitrella brassicaformis (strain CCMP3155) TaxID=1169540 RepID=A0A0G4ES44_VITBC|nr:unnamed protein product [Vitrella brassicaformis CCMP3155]|eukprot:CEM00229.1 unnamed protein product [Vitrella brassicaformis CCMP3155]